MLFLYDAIYCSVLIPNSTSVPLCLAIETLYIYAESCRAGINLSGRQASAGSYGAEFTQSHLGILSRCVRRLLTLNPHTWPPKHAALAILRATLRMSRTCTPQSMLEYKPCSESIVPACVGTNRCRYSPLATYHMCHPVIHKFSNAWPRRRRLIRRYVHMLWLWRDAEVKLYLLCVYKAVHAICTYSCLHNAPTSQADILFQHAFPLSMLGWE